MMENDSQLTFTDAVAKAIEHIFRDIEKLDKLNRMSYELTASLIKRLERVERIIAEKEEDSDEKEV